MPPNTTGPPILIVGAGLAGLCSALHLQRAGHRVRILEASEAPGGRVRTDQVEGFALDRGFQVLLSSYPEARATLDLPALGLGRFVPGALIWNGRKLVKVADPMRRPQDLVATLGSGMASVGDAWRLLRWRLRSLGRSPADWLQEDDTLDAEAALRADGFSNRMIEGFWRPFLGGVLLDRELRASRRTLDFLFAMFATGAAALPRGGMGAISEQLAGRLAPGTLQTSRRVVDVEPGAVRLDSGERITGSTVVMASDPSSAARLLPDLPVPEMRRTGCLYLDAPRSAGALAARHLVLDGVGAGPVNHLCMPSQVAEGYAPEGRTLVSASLLGDALEQGDDALEKSARDQIRGWFGPGVDDWRTLRLVRVQEALPAQPPGPFAAVEKPARLDDGLFVAGDHRNLASIQGAMASGRATARAVADSLA